MVYAVIAVAAVLLNRDFLYVLDSLDDLATDECLHLPTCHNLLLVLVTLVFGVIENLEFSHL